MFETHKYARNKHDLSPASPDRAYTPEFEIATIANLYWAEHCVECAAPSCYSSCDLYEPRSDYRCRRFVFGQYKNKAFASFRGYGVEIAFKKWAKLESFAVGVTYDVKRQLLFERAKECASVIGNLIERLAGRLSSSRKWNELTYRVMAKNTRRLKRGKTVRRNPEAFLLEVYNPGQDEVRVQVIFSPSDDNRSVVPPVIRSFPLPPGYSKHEISGHELQQFLETPKLFKITIVPEADSEARLVFLTADLVTFEKGVQPAGSEITETRTIPIGTNIKCVVFDLDQTLWSGILAEGDHLRLYPGILDLLRVLDERGILLSIASKNDFNSAWVQLRKMGIAQYFLHPQIDWLAKQQKIKAIARALNIGLDVIAFVDDNPFELDEVSYGAPEVTCIPVGLLPQLSTNSRFQGSATSEARERRKMYQQLQHSREIAQTDFGGDYLSFLASCETKLKIADYAETELDRVNELVQRTNQLNFSGMKYTRDEVSDLLADPSLSCFLLRCSDKYGSYGMVGFCAIRHRPNALEIAELMLSCRIQGRYLEKALLAHLLSEHSGGDTKIVRINYRKTNRNTPAFDVLQSLGFRESDEGKDLALPLDSQSQLHCSFIDVQCTARCGGSSTSALKETLSDGMPPD